MDVGQRGLYLSVSITMDTHYDITLGNDVAKNAHFGNDVTRNIHCDITMHNDVAMNLLLLCILCYMPNCVILLWVVWNKNKNKFVFDQSVLENTFVVFCVELQMLDEANVRLLSHKGSGCYIRQLSLYWSPIVVKWLPLYKACVYWCVLQKSLNSLEIVYDQCSIPCSRLFSKVWR